MEGNVQVNLKGTRGLKRTERPVVAGERVLEGDVAPSRRRRVRLRLICRMLGRSRWNTRRRW